MEERREKIKEKRMNHAEDQLCLLKKLLYIIGIQQSLILDD